MSEWIKCSERMPKDDELVIVHGGVAYVRTDRHGLLSWYTITGERFPGSLIQWPVTHWMPLPAPPIPSGDSTLAPQAGVKP